MRYSDYQQSAASVGDASTARLALGVVAALTLFGGWLAFIGVCVASLSGMEMLSAMEVTRSVSTQTAAGALVVLLLVGGLGFGTFVAARFVHGLKVHHWMGRRTDVVRGLALAAISAACLGVLPLIYQVQGNIADQQYAFVVWLFLLPFGLGAIAIQTGAEEVFFRGYLQNRLAARFKSPVAWVGLPALAFGAAHFDADLPLSAGLTYAAFAFLFGILAGDLTARSGSIGAAWGLHFANNALAILGVATQGTITGLGLYRTADAAGQSFDFGPSIAAEFLILIASWLLIRRLTSR